MESVPCLLTVHAHPDDESSKGAGTVARYHDAGVRTVLVCCTGGEEGDILNPAMDRPEVRANLAQVRREELEAATEIIGYDEVVMLGYRDSGMPDSEANARPDCFARAPLEEATARLVAVIRRARPQVMVIYGEEQSGYPHPDHLRVHEVGLAAFHAAGRADRFPDTGEPHQPEKLYYTVFSVSRFRELHEKFEELGLESPFDAQWRARWESVREDRTTTAVDISDYADIRGLALRAHATQVDPNSPFWFGLPPEVMRSIHPQDDYQLALVRQPDGTVTPPGPLDEVETDLFAGLAVGDRVG